MIWGAISYYGLSNLEGVQNTINSNRYCAILEEALLPFLPKRSEEFGHFNTMVLPSVDQIIQNDGWMKGIWMFYPGQLSLQM